MAPSAKRQRYHLQGISFARGARSLCIVLALLAFAGGAAAQIIPFSGTLHYQAGQYGTGPYQAGQQRAAAGAWSTMVIKSANSSPAYVLSLEPGQAVQSDLSYLDVVLRRPGAPPDAPNLLDPPYRWHGLQEYMFNARDLMDGPDHAAFGRVRELHIKNRKLDVVIAISNAEIATTTAHPSEPMDYVFKRLDVDVTVENMK